MRIFILGCLFLLGSCSKPQMIDTIAPDGFMIGHSLSGPHSTFGYVNWVLPQPSELKAEMEKKTEQ